MCISGPPIPPRPPSLNSHFFSQHHCHVLLYMYILLKSCNHWPWKVVSSHFFQFWNVNRHLESYKRVWGFLFPPVCFIFLLREKGKIPVESSSTHQSSLYCLLQPSFNVSTALLFSIFVLPEECHVFFFCYCGLFFFLFLFFVFSLAFITPSLPCLPCLPRFGESFFLIFFFCFFFPSFLFCFGVKRIAGLFPMMFRHVLGDDTASRWFLEFGAVINGYPKLLSKKA